MANKSMFACLSLKEKFAVNGLHGVKVSIKDMSVFLLNDVSVLAAGAFCVAVEGINFKAVIDVPSPLVI